MSVPRSLVPLLLLLIALNAGVWSDTIPFNGAPDEWFNLEAVAFLSQERRLPVLGTDQSVQWMAWPTKKPLTEEDRGRLRSGEAFPVLPALPYAVLQPAGYAAGALVAAALPRGLPVFRRARVASALFMVLACWFTYATSLILQPDRKGLAAAVLVFVGFLPQHTFLGSYVNADAFAAFTGALTVWALARCLRSGWRTREASVLGAAMGLVCLSRANAYVILPFVVGMLWVDRGRNPLEAARLTLVLLGLTLTLAGWSFWRNARLYQGDPFAIAAVQRDLRRLHAASPPEVVRNVSPLISALRPPAGLGDVWERLRGSLFSRSFNAELAESFFGRFGWMDLRMPRGCYALFGAIAVGGLLGAGRRLARGLRTGSRSRADLLHLAFVGMVLLEYALVVWNAVTHDRQAQGRFFYPVVGPISLLLIHGLWRLVPDEEAGERLAAAAAALTCLANFLAFWTAILYTP